MTRLIDADALKQCTSKLVKIAAQLAMKQSMPDVENVEYSVNIPKKSWRSISKMNHKAYEQCNDWAIELRSIFDEITNAPTVQQSEPFGYFKAEPFGWTDCAETDEGAIALYEAPKE